VLGGKTFLFVMLGGYESRFFYFSKYEIKNFAKFRKISLKKFREISQNFVELISRNFADRVLMVIYNMTISQNTKVIFCCEISYRENSYPPCKVGLNDGIAIIFRILEKMHI
jgi:hypothetical protein